MFVCTSPVIVAADRGHANHLLTVILASRARWPNMSPRAAGQPTYQGRAGSVTHYTPRLHAGHRRCRRRRQGQPFLAFLTEIVTYAVEGGVGEGVRREGGVGEGGVIWSAAAAARSLR